MSVDELKARQAGEKAAIKRYDEVKGKLDATVKREVKSGEQLKMMVKELESTKATSKTISEAAAEAKAKAAETKTKMSEGLKREVSLRASPSA